MKNTFNVTYKNSSRVIAIFFAVVILAWLIAGCGDSDNPTGGNNPPTGETTVVSLDSVVSRSTLPAANDSLIAVNFADIDSARLSFTLESNFPGSSRIVAEFDSAVSDSVAGMSVWEIPFNQSQNESFTIGFKPDNTHRIFKIAVGHILNGPPAYTFVKLSNIKLVKIR